MAKKQNIKQPEPSFLVSVFVKSMELFLAISGVTAVIWALKLFLKVVGIIN